MRHKWSRFSAISKYLNVFLIIFQITIYKIVLKRTFITLQFVCGLTLIAKRCLEKYFIQKIFWIKKNQPRLNLIIHAYENIFLRFVPSYQLYEPIEINNYDTSRTGHRFATSPLKYCNEKVKIFFTHISGIIDALIRANKTKIFPSRVRIWNARHFRHLHITKRASIVRRRKFQTGPTSIA